MVDNRSAGHFGIGGAMNFKSGDISGTAAKTSDEKLGQGGEYFAFGRQQEEEEKKRQPVYVDRSAQLRASLASLAMINSVNMRLKIKEREEAKKKSKPKKMPKKILTASENEAEKD